MPENRIRRLRLARSLHRNTGATRITLASGEDIHRGLRHRSRGEAFGELTAKVKLHPAEKHEPNRNQNAQGYRPQAVTPHQMDDREQEKANSDTEIPPAPAF